MILVYHTQNVLYSFFLKYFLKKDNLLKEVEKKVIPKIVLILNKFYNLLLSDSPYLDKIAIIKQELGDIDANKPEIYDF